MIDFAAFSHPVLAVPCPDCDKRAGAMCIRPSGHKASDFHRARKVAADRQFIAQHGATASIERTAAGWRIDLEGYRRASKPDDRLQLSLSL